MTPSEFIRKWSDGALRERQGAQEHFIDLCRLLGEPTPAEDDPHGDHYCFERGAEKVGGGEGRADVWRRGCFGWEYKGRHKDLNAALRQLQAYALDLENPPYLVVSDMEHIIVHTNWTNTISKIHEFGFDDLRVPAKLDDLRAVFQGSERLKPGLSPQEITAKVAARFGELGKRLQERGHAPRAVAHFLNRIVFCMFAEDARLLPEKLLSRVLKATVKRPDHAGRQLAELFSKMATGGFFGADAVRWFDGGLFEDASVLPLTEDDLKLISETAEAHDWSEIDPAIFGTLFEQALKATRERPALGAHYTDREKILKIVEPVIVRPLTAEWEAAFAAIKAAMEEAGAAEERRRAVLVEAAEALKREGAAAKAGEAKRRKEVTAALKARDAAVGRAKDRFEAFLARLAAFRVLDPACGSGNFLYVALHALKDLELRAHVDAARSGLEPPAPRVGLETVKGIEIEPYAAELARVTLWIGDLQWMRKNGYSAYKEPILSSLDQIEERDALLNKDGSEAEWPKADVIIGNPPFLGGKRMRTGLGDDTVDRLFTRYDGRVPAEADFVCYWVEKAWAAIEAGSAERAGLVTTNSIRGGASRKVVDPIADADAIFEAWADEPWVLEGAAVRVSMLGFGKGFTDRRLEGLATAQINADLTSASVDLVGAARLRENKDVAFMGGTKGGPFDVPGDLARTWLQLPINPNGRPNSDVLTPWINALDVTRRSNDGWLINFGLRMNETEAALYQAPFEYALTRIKPARLATQKEEYRREWWRHVRPRPEMWAAIGSAKRFIVTPVVAKHRVFVWVPSTVWPSNLLDVIARDEDTTFGILHSRFHELWSLRKGTWLGVGNDPRYTPSTTFETFPFPEGMTPNIPSEGRSPGGAAAEPGLGGAAGEARPGLRSASPGLRSDDPYADDPRAVAIAQAARELDRLREAWLNPADLVVVEPEIMPTAAPGEAPVKYPDRILPKDEAAAKELKKRTLTNLYNERPQWLANAHARLDAAVAAAYGWPADLSDEEVLERLFALNQQRAAAER